MGSLHLALGSHLFPLDIVQRQVHADDIFMCECKDLAAHYRYHKLKIHFFFTSMRRYSLELQAHWPVHYYDIEQTMGQQWRYFDCLEQHINDRKIRSISCFSPEDRFFKEALEHFCAAANLDLTLLTSPYFLNTSEEFRRYLDEHKKPFLKQYYEQQRRQKNILMEGSKPQQGQFSFDQDNRKKLPKKFEVPNGIIEREDTYIHTQVVEVVERYFGQHPGSLDERWYATSTAEARQCLQLFLQERLVHFGDYQDAFSDQHPFLFHSLLSPYINNGLLTPKEVLETTLEYAERHEVPMNAIEGFVRQLMGWREFVFGIDQHFGEQQAQSNFFKHERELTNAWYTGSTGLPPLDDAISKTLRYGYNHHIERLMVIGNIMLLCEIEPSQVYRWFMEMYIDSADWVMGPNVYGMSQFSDGGIFATKPYICGSNYLIKMGYGPKGDWQDIVDGLYWRFIHQNREYFKSQPRLSMMPRQLEKMKADRLDRIFKAAEGFLEQNTA